MSKICPISISYELLVRLLPTFCKAADSAEKAAQLSPEDPRFRVIAEEARSTVRLLRGMITTVEENEVERKETDARIDRCS